MPDYFPGQVWEPGMWSLLGGGREPPDATLEHTVRRELDEEAGLHIADLTPFAIEEATDDAGASVPVAVYAGRRNGDPRETNRIRRARAADGGACVDDQPKRLQYRRTPSTASWPAPAWPSTIQRHRDHPTSATTSEQGERSDRTR
ncbi:NUDIX domain-containing protein [Streptomyces flaveolus]|uniref:NUDIX domain-containing protein n=1 Tax=Streptomyces flaveolus TaxID=67297 RepID=UPI00367D6A9D